MKRFDFRENFHHIYNNDLTKSRQLIAIRRMAGEAISHLS